MPKMKTPAEQRAELMREIEENNQEIARLEHRQKQLDHQMTREKNVQSYIAASRRKARTHRLVTKGASVEHHLPETKELTEREFYELMENVLALPEAKRMVASAVERHKRMSNG